HNDFNIVSIVLHFHLLLYSLSLYSPFFFFFNDTATTEIYTLSLHDALPISLSFGEAAGLLLGHLLEHRRQFPRRRQRPERDAARSEEHTSELQSRGHLVCRLLLEKKKKKKSTNEIISEKKQTEHNYHITTTY